MIGFGADQGRRAFDRVDAAHLAAGLVRTAAGGELAGIGEPARHSPKSDRSRRRRSHPPPRRRRPGRAAGQRLGGWPRARRRDGAAPIGASACRGTARCSAAICAISDGEVTVPVSTPQSLAAARRSWLAALEHHRKKSFPGVDLALADDALGAARVVELEDGRLHDRTGGAEARRVVRIAFDFERTAPSDARPERRWHSRRWSSPSRNSARCPGTIPGGWTT